MCAKQHFGNSMMRIEFTRVIPKTLTKYVWCDLCHEIIPQNTPYSHTAISTPGRNWMVRAHIGCAPVGTRADGLAIQAEVRTPTTEGTWCPMCKVPINDEWGHAVVFSHAGQIKTFLVHEKCCGVKK